MGGKGFGALTPEERRERASAGGKASQASGAGHRFNADEARAAGRKGGAKSQAKRNAAKDKEKAP